jgi:hypothetical protein
VIEFVSVEQEKFTPNQGKCFMNFTKIISIFFFALTLCQGAFAQHGHWHRPRPRPVPRPRPIPAPAPLLRACFYEFEHFKGRSFCVRPGSSIPSLAHAGFNNTISSAIIPRGFRVFVYEYSDFRGNNLALQGYIPSLRRFGGFWDNWNNSISSIDFR